MSAVARKAHRDRLHECDRPAGIIAVVLFWTSRWDVDVLNVIKIILKNVVVANPVLALVMVQLKV